MTSKYLWYRKVGDKLLPLMSGDLFDPKCIDLCLVTDSGTMEVIVVLASRKILARFKKEWQVSNLDVVLQHHEVAGKTIEQYIEDMISNTTYYPTDPIDQLMKYTVHIPVSDIPAEIKKEIGWI